MSLPGERTYITPPEKEEISEFVSVANDCLQVRIAYHTDDQAELKRSLAEVKKFLTGFMKSPNSKLPVYSSFDFYVMLNGVFELPSLEQQARAGVTTNQFLRKINARLVRRLKAIDQLTADPHFLTEKRLANLFHFLKRLENEINYGFRLRPTKHY